jgi:hypothetical protein
MFASEMPGKGVELIKAVLRWETAGFDELARKRSDERSG